jgi:hypothetical protein
MPTQREGKVGPNIVRAWFDTVVNPLLRGLDSERNLLAKENWTWRFEQQALLSLVHVPSFIAFEALDNLDQFLRMAPVASQQCLPLMDLHDDQVDYLTDVCRVFHKALRNSEDLANLYRRMAKENAVPCRPGQTFDSFFGAYHPAVHLDVLAENIVNGTGLLPTYFTTAPLWNHYRDELLGLRETLDIRPHWDASRMAGQDLKDTVEKLIDSLKLIRQELSIEYDLPLVEARLT